MTKITLPLEGATLEYKRELPSTDKLARTFVAMANGKGGKLVIGVTEEPRRVIGITPNQRVEEHISNVAAQACSPPVEYDLSYETVTGKTVLFIEVRQGLSKPYYVKRLGLERGTYVRVGSICRLVDRDGLQRLLLEGQNRTFDRSPSTLLRSAIDTSLIQEYLSRRRERLGISGKQISDSLLRDLDLIIGNKLTIAGSLLFTSHPQQDPQLTLAVIRAGRFHGGQPGEFVDQQEISGNLTEQIKQAVKFVLRNIPQRRASSGVRREDRFEYPVEVVREVITNAVAHRDYSRQHESIRLAIYDDRIEVTSPGNLPGTVTVDNLLHRQYSRNPIIAKRLFEMGYLEAWGLGIDTIVNWSTAAGRRPPFFSDENDQFICIIYGSATESDAGSKILPDTQQKVLDLLKHQVETSNSEIREHLGLSKMQAQTLLKKMLKSKLIARRGKGRAVHYVKRG